MKSSYKKFEVHWLRETMKEIINTAWEKAKLACLGPSLADRTKAVHADLHTWGRDILKGPKKKNH